MSGMFSNCSNLTTIPQLGTSSVTQMSNMFSGCSKLTTIPQLDTSSVTMMRYMFKDCSNLTTIPQLNTSSVTYTSNMFSGCSNLTTIPKLDTSSVIDMSNMFSGCSNLTTITQLDLRSVRNEYYAMRMFEGCSKLENCYLRNIKASLTISSGTTYGHLLTVDSLLYMIKELVNTGSSNTFIIGTENISKLSDTYVKLINITDEMRAEDDLIDSKLPFEVCEKTDEGALPILTRYVELKRWSISY